MNRLQAAKTLRRGGDNRVWEKWVFISAVALAGEGDAGDDWK